MRRSQTYHVSAAFYLSIEFQQTGYLVYKTYGTAFGTTRIAATVPLTRSEFLPDVQSVAQGVVVGAPGGRSSLKRTRRLTSTSSSSARTSWPLIRRR
ncbi:MAG: hypothetical protein ACREBG_09865 [Pyrinomonadaceae bacterium]